jgi:hypothetical protein
MRIRILGLLAASAAGLLLAGCDDSKNPLSSPQASKPDAKLAGLWRLKDKDGNVTYYHIGVLGGKAPASVMRVVNVQHLKDGSLQEPGEFFVFPTVLGDSTYLNMGGDQPKLKLLEEKGWTADGIDSYFILKFRIEGDTLVLRTMDREAKRKAIEGQKVKGVIETPAGPGPERIQFTDTTENLARFVSGAGDSLFSKEPLRLERVK